MFTMSRLPCFPSKFPERVSLSTHANLLFRDVTRKMRGVVSAPKAANDGPQQKTSQHPQNARQVHGSEGVNDGIESPVHQVCIVGSGCAQCSTWLLAQDVCLKRGRDWNCVCTQCGDHLAASSCGVVSVAIRGKPPNVSSVPSSSEREE